MTLHLHRGRWWPIYVLLLVCYLTSRRDVLPEWYIVCCWMNQYLVVNQGYQWYTCYVEVVFFQTAQPHLHPLPWAPHLNDFQPNILLIPLTRVRFKFSTKLPSGFPSRGPVRNFEPTILPDLPAGSMCNFQPNILTYNPARFHSYFPQETSISRLEITSIYPPQQNSNTIPQIHAVYKITPIEPPSTHPNHHPYYYTTNTPCNLPTSTPPHTWDIPVRLGGHKSHNVIVIKAGCHFRVQ